MIGRRPESTVGGHEASRIATGAPIPAGADTIVPVENAEVLGEVVRIIEPAPEGRHIRPVGEDVRAGAVLVEQGRRLGRAGARPPRQRRASRTPSCTRGRA